MAVEDLTGQHISSTYQRLLQISSSGEMANGTGSLYIPPLSVTASFAISASYALSSSHEIVKEISSSHADTASYVNTLNQDVFINGDLTLTGSLLASGSNSIINTQELQFNVDHIKSGHSTGRMFWDDDNKTITVDMQGSDVRLQLGQEEHVYAKNTSGEVINNGDAVRISGAVGANVTIQKAISSIKSFKDPTEQDQILGLATEQIADNKSGYITTFGAVRDLNTSAFNEGDILYLSNTSSGSYSSVRPPAPFFEARIGIVQVSNATEGIILVRPSEPIFLTDISQITGSGVIVGGTSYLCYDDNTEIIEFTNSFTGSFSGSFEGDGSGLTNIPTTPTASYALTASYVETAQTASYIISSSIDGISNYVRNDQTSSMTVLSSSFATTASYVLNSVSSSYSAFATTASYAENSNLLDGRDSTTFTSTSSFNSFTSSYYIDSASFDTRIISNSSSISALSSSYLLSSASFASDILTNSSSIALLSSSFVTFSASYNTGSFTGSFLGEATLDSLIVNGPITFKTYRLTSSAYTASIDDYRIGVKYTLTGSVEIQLPLISAAGELEYKFKDEEGNAKKQNITIIASGSDLIDGDVNAILNRNYMAIGLYNDGVSNWYIE